MTYAVVCLAENPDLLNQCIDLLNEQWPRSRTARLRSLEQTKTDSFPTSLLLVQRPKCGGSVVVGHSKILPVPYNEKACFVESVVISRCLRGKGLGRLIMEETENFVKRKGISTVHLTTYDQQGFYEKLGYALSDPVVIYGGISTKLQKLIENTDSGLDPQHPKEQESSADNKANALNQQLNKEQPTAPVPNAPPPPPVVPPAPPIVKLSTDSIKKVYMIKNL